MNLSKLPILRNIEEWDKIAIKMRIELALNGKKNFKRDFRDKYFSSRHPKTALEISAMWQLYNHIKKIDRLNLLYIPESQKGNPYEIMLDCLTLSWDWLQAKEEFYSIIDTFKLNPKRKIKICEIGGGYGRLAEVFLKVFKDIEYIMIDIEPSLGLAKWYLSEYKNVKYYTPSDNFRLKNTDLFINVDSFQEMSDGIIMNYFDLMQKTGYRYIYLKNAKDGVHNLCNTLNFNLIHYPKEINMKIINEKVSYTQPDMVEQFIAGGK